MASKVVRSGLVASMALAGVLAAAPLAQAATPPSCVSTTRWSSYTWKFARATNRCNGPQRFKFIWAYAFDGTCVYYASGDSRTENRGSQSRFDGLQSC